MPEKAVAERSPPREEKAPRFRRPPPDEIARAARRAVRGGRASFASLSAFRAAVLADLRHDEPLATVGGPRLRRLLVSVPGVRLSVRYTERPDGTPPARCPVCDGELEPIRNRTLAGETIVLGHRCVRCAYWTHAARRVPVRYLVTRGEPRRRGSGAR